MNEDALFQFIQQHIMDRMAAKEFTLATFAELWILMKQLDDRLNATYLQWKQLQPSAATTPEMDLLFQPDYFRTMTLHPRRKL